MTKLQFVGPNGETLTIKKTKRGAMVLCHAPCKSESIFNSICSAGDVLPVEQLTITLSGQLTSYYAWDYNAKEVMEYRRLGQCNRCGECCQKRVEFQTASNDDAPMGEDRNGGYTTNDRGVWYELDGCSPRRFFGEFKISDGDGCPSLSFKDRQARCNNYFERCNLCRDWPLGPELLEHFLQCGYSFEEVDRTALEDLEEEKLSK